MDILISNSSGVPHYEQIEEQIKRQIITGELHEGDALPSMRILAGEVYLFGKSIDNGSASLREDIGVVFDEMGFHDFLTARQINTIMKNVYKNWKEEND